MKTRPVWILSCLTWLLAVCAGAWVLSNYDNSAGRAGEALSQWPADAQIAIQTNQPVLIMFAHPQCPCTRASIDELNRLMARCADTVAAHVFFYQPDGVPKDWTQSGLWKSAAAIPGVQVHADPEGREARLFGAESSGHVVLYDVHGHLIFHGGITSARGHAGDNAGENTVIGLLAGTKTPLNETPVFGCGLLDKTELVASRP